MQDKHLLIRARALRNAATPFEDKLWRQLSGSKFHGFKFRRQHVINNAIVDFFCPAKGLIVEIDGETHDIERDTVRDRRHEAQGYLTIRFTNRDVGSNLDAVLEALGNKLRTMPDRWTGESGQPHPLTPSPEGEGK